MDGHPSIMDCKSWVSSVRVRPSPRQVGDVAQMVEHQTRPSAHRIRKDFGLLVFILLFRFKSGLGYGILEYQLSRI